MAYNDRKKTRQRVKKERSIRRNEKNDRRKQLSPMIQPYNNTPKNNGHIYSAKKQNKFVRQAREPQQQQQQVNMMIASDAPTALIAPDDYEHIFSAKKQANIHKVKGKYDDVRKFASDAPTALIAPEDYEHIYSAKKQANIIKVKEKYDELLKYGSDAPTALIAPEDYAHIYSAKKVIVIDKMTAKNQPLGFASDDPTAIIAPADYEHIYSAKKDNKRLLKEQVPQAFASDAPTALIAPDDYQHIYCAKKQTNLMKMQNGTKIMTKYRSDDPTALIAPDDYEHIYSAAKKAINNKIYGKLIAPEDYEQIYKRQQIQSGRPKQTNFEFASDAPTAIIAPDDYEHIYSAKKQQTPQTQQQLITSPQLLQNGKIVIDINDTDQLLQLFRIIQTLKQSMNVQQDNDDYYEYSDQNRPSKSRSKTKYIGKRR